MKITFSDSPPDKADAIVVTAFAGRHLGAAAKSIDEKSDATLTRAMRASRFSGAKEQFLDILMPAGIDASRVVVAGLGKRGSVKALTLQNLGGGLVAQLNRSGAARAAVLVDEADDDNLPTTARAANLAFGACLSAYRFDKYRTKEKPETKPTLSELTIVSKSSGKAKAAFARFQALADGVFLTRDLVSEPPNVIYPQTFAERAKSLSDLGVDVEILDEAKM